MANAGSIIVLLFLYFSTSNCSHRGGEAGLKWGLQCGPLRSEIRDLRSDPIRSSVTPSLFFDSPHLTLYTYKAIPSHFSTATKLFEPLRMRVIAKVFYYYRISVVRFFFFAIFLHIYIYIFCINKQESQSHSYSVINIK